MYRKSDLNAEAQRRGESSAEEKEKSLCVPLHFPPRLCVEKMALRPLKSDFRYTLSDKLSEHPESAPVFEGDVRRLVMRGYPFGIFFTVEGGRLMV